MAKCSFKTTSEGYACPNEAHHDGKCYLHYTPTAYKADDNILIEVHKEFENYFSTDYEEIVIEDVFFPENYQIKLPHYVCKPVIFRECYLSSTFEINGSHRLISLLFEGCKLTNLRIHDLSDACCVNVRESKINKEIKIWNINGIDFDFKIHESQFNKIYIKHVHIKNGLEILPDDYIEACSIIDSSFLSASEIQMDLKPTLKDKNRIEFIEVNFISRFDIITKSRIEFDNCAIDGLFIRNFKLKDNYKNPNAGVNEIADEKYIFRKPYSIKKLRKVSKLFDAINNEDFNEFINYVRNMKKYFRDTEHRELYDLYYILDQRYSCKLKNYGWSNRWINRFSRWFSFYGYSINRPVISLLIVLIIFNIAYLIFDYSNIHKNISFPCAFERTTLHHLSKISFFKSPDGWFPSGSWKSTVFIVELLLLISIFTSIVLGIRKLFKRT